MIWRLLKKLANLHPPLRPPGALPEAVFQRLCIRCRKCAQVCPYGTIRMTHGEWGLKMGTPVIYPRQVPCYLCLKCPAVCPTDALEPITEMAEVKMGTATINTAGCLPYNGVLCRACYERCPIYREAITLKEEIYPVVHPEKCVGCGICENVCPTEPASIRVFSRHFED